MRGDPRLLLASAVLAIAACASPPPGEDLPHPIAHEGFGVRAQLEGWEVFTDPASAPALLRPAFGGKRGPDDPPWFVATRQGWLLTAAVYPGEHADSAALFEALAARTEDPITHAIRLPDGDVLFRLRTRVGTEVLNLLHAAEGGVVHVSLTGIAAPPPLEAFRDTLRHFELRTHSGWRAPWQLELPLEGEELVGTGSGAADPFEAVECAPGAHPLLWAASGRSGTLYLFGSIHFGHASFYPFAPAIEAAFAGAERLAVEADVASGGLELAEETLARLGAPEGAPLSSVLSPELYAQLTEIAAEYGLPMEVLDDTSPGLLGTTLAVLPFVRRGFDPRMGVDLYFLQRAGSREVVELESVEGQLALLGDFDESFLRYTIESLEQADANVDALHAAWRCGDEAALLEVALEEDGADAMTPEQRAWLEAWQESFFYDRNERMAARIAELLAEDGDTFVVVGAAHLVGERGIPALLRAAGHAVDRVGP